MEYRIIEKEAFNVIGKLIKVSTKNEGHHSIISQFWENPMVMEHVIILII